MSRTNTNFVTRKEKLIQQALEVFIEKGYENTTIVDLQHRFGLTKGGMYHYFHSKEDILDAVIAYGLTQSVLELETELEKVPLEEKLVRFFFSSTTNDFTNKLFKYCKNSHTSIVPYRLREKTVELTAPILKSIMRLYVEAGLYHTAFPDEMAEFSVILAKAIAEDWILPKTDYVHRKRRADALIDLWSKCTQAPAAHIHELRFHLHILVDSKETEQVP